MSESQRYQFIDCLRAVAVLLVLVTHIAELYVSLADPNGRDGQWIAAWAHEYRLGRAGVTLFFIISGFVIPSSFSGTQGDGAKKFIITRFFRLFPLFWVSIVLSLPTQNWGAGKYPSAIEVAANMTMVPVFFGVTEINGAYWTLAVELIFYGLCLVLFLSGLVRNQPALAILCLIFNYSFINLEYTHNLKIADGVLGEFPVFLGFMFWGALSRIRFEQGRLSPFAELVFWIVALGWLFAFPMAGFHEAHVRHHAEPDMVPRLYGGYFAPFAAFFFSYFFFRLQNRVLVYIGKISYSIYLLQGAVMFGCLYVVDHAFPEMYGKLSLYVTLPAIAALTILASTVTYRWVEVPAQRLGRRIVKRVCSPYGAPVVDVSLTEKGNKGPQSVSR